ncbi:MAG: aquaporin [Patescibacteria group bacterium]|jgi:aquaporin Z|nr:aquaporin [Patescibacteria group bacterium]
MIKQRHVAALLAEFIGTATLALVVLSVLSSQLGLPFFVAMAAGVTLAVFANVFGNVSGVHFNPAITFGLFVIRQISALRAVGYIVVQVLGGFVAWQLYERLAGNTLDNRSASEVDWKILGAEFIGALVFGAVVAAVVTQKVKGHQAAFGVGGGLFIGILIASLGSGAILNPAVAVAMRSLDVNYFTGPVLGALTGMLLVALFIVPVFNPVKKLKKKSVGSDAPKVVEESPTVVSEVKKPVAKKPVAKKPATKKATVKKKTTKK